MYEMHVVDSTSVQTSAVHFFFFFSRTTTRWYTIVRIDVVVRLARYSSIIVGCRNFVMISCDGGLRLPLLSRHPFQADTLPKLFSRPYYNTVVFLEEARGYVELPGVRTCTRTDLFFSRLSYEYVQEPYFWYKITKFSRRYVEVQDSTPPCKPVQGCIQASLWLSCSREGEAFTPLQRWVGRLSRKGDILAYIFFLVTCFLLGRLLVACWRDSDPGSHTKNLLIDTTTLLESGTCLGLSSRVVFSPPFARRSSLVEFCSLTHHTCSTTININTIILWYDTGVLSTLKIGRKTAHGRGLNQWPSA